MHSPELVLHNAALRRPPRDDFAACPELRLRSVMWINCFRKIMRITNARVVLARASPETPRLCPQPGGRASALQMPSISIAVAYLNEAGATPQLLCHFVADLAERTRPL